MTYSDNNASYRSVQECLSISSFTVHVNIRMGRQFSNFASSSLTVRLEEGMRVLENSVLTEVLGREGQEVSAQRGAGRKGEILLCVNSDLIVIE